MIHEILKSVVDFQYMNLTLKTVIDLFHVVPGMIMSSAVSSMESLRTSHSTY